MRKFSALLVILAIVCLVSACGVNEISNTIAPASETASPASATASPSSTETPDVYTEILVPASDKFTDFDRRISFGQSSDVKITLSDGSKSTSSNLSSVDISGDVVTIKQGGVYVLSGKLSNGQLIVDVEKTEKVQLVLNGVDITCLSSSAIWIKSADKVAITLPEGSTSILTDSKTYSGQNEKGEPSACVFSKDDLTINGYGTLTINGNYNNGIATKNDFKFVSGNVTVNAANNGIKGKGSISINTGSLTVVSSDDGIKSDEDSKTDKGYVVIEGGNITITCEDDAITAFNSVVITDGLVTTYAKGKVINCDGIVDVKTGCVVSK